MKHATTKVYCIAQGTIVNMVPGGSNGKESACNAEDPGSIPGLERSPGNKSGYPLQYSCLESSMDRKSAVNSPSHLNAEFQRIARRDKKAFLSD